MYFKLGEEYYVDIKAIPERERIRGELDFIVAEIKSLREEGKTLGGWKVGSAEQVAYEIEQREKLAGPLRQQLSEHQT